MILAVALFLTMQASPAVTPPANSAQPVKPVLVPPADWSSLAPLPFRTVPTITSRMTAYVGGEVKAGRCFAPQSVDGRYHVAIEVAVLLSPDDGIRRVIPRAFNCPTAEQYGVGLVTGFMRGNLQSRHAVADQWYRTTLTFDW